MKHAILLIIMLCFGVTYTHAQIDNQHLEIGDVAPNFTGTDQNGKQVDLKALLKEGKVVLMFYRGSWCPYCKKHLSELQAELEYITKKGASVVVVTPEKAASIKKTVNNTGATFSILNDADYKIMDDYQVAFKIDQKTVPHYYSYVLKHTRRSNENEDDVLPVPATYIIGQDGKITYVHYNPNYKERAAIEEVIENL